MESARPLRDVFADLADPATGHEDASPSAADARALLAQHADLPDELLVTAIGSYANTAPAEVAEHLAGFVTAPGADAARGLELLTSAPVGGWEGEVDLDDHQPDVEPSGILDLNSEETDIDDLDGGDHGGGVHEPGLLHPGDFGDPSDTSDFGDTSDSGDTSDTVDSVDTGDFDDSVDFGDLGGLGSADSLDLDETSTFGTGDDGDGEDSGNGDHHHRESHDGDGQYLDQHTADQPVDLDDPDDLPDLDAFDA